MTPLSAPTAAFRPSDPSVQLPRPAVRSVTEFAPQPSDAPAPERAGERALHRAAAALRRDWRAAKDGVSVETEVLLDALLAAIETAAAGGVPPVAAIPPCAPVAAHLGALRRGLLAQARVADRPLSRADLVRLLDAIERVQEAVERDALRNAATQLSGAAARELVMEVAHDMRSPLASVLFLVETLRSERSGRLTPVQQRQLGIVYSATFGLSALTTDLIELAHGGSRLVDGPPTPFSIATVLHGVQAMLAPIAEEKGLDLRIEPASEGDCRLGHAAALARILLNLATNALKFTPAGSVTISAAPVGATKVEFTVSDSGPGIPPAIEDTLCDAFRRRNGSTGHAFSSAGLGLAICRRLVTSLGTDLSIDSRPGRGTRFSFALDLPTATML
jgi:signal transduction histidine kinase